MNKWHKGIVATGNKFGTMLGFPTLNIKNPEILQGKKLGVYAAFVKIRKKIYQAVLFFGPRLIFNEKKVILEIFVLNFNEQIYNQSISFKLVEYLRPPRNFLDTESLKKQLVADCQKAKEILTRFPK